MNVDRLAGERAHVAEMVRLHGPSIATVARWAVDTGHPDIACAIIAGSGRAWPNFADPLLLIDPGMEALDRTRTTDPALRLRSLAHLSFLHTPERPEIALALLTRLVDEFESSVDVDPLTSQIVASTRAAVPYRAGPDRGIPDTSVNEAHAQLDRSMDLAVAMGYPIEPHLYSRAVFREDIGDVDGAISDLRRLLAWAADHQPLWTGMALHLLGKHQALAGDHAAGVASAAEAARLLVDGGDLDFAAEAEMMIAGIECEREHFDDAQASIERLAPVPRTGRAAAGGHRRPRTRCRGRRRSRRMESVRSRRCSVPRPSSRAR